METQTFLHSQEITEKSSDIPEDSGTEEDMAPQGSDSALSNAQNGGMNMYDFSGSFTGKGKRQMSTEEEDGEILEDGEIASDEGEVMGDDGEVTEDNIKSSPRKKGHKEDRDRHHNKRDRHSKRRRSKEDGHRDKQQKKKRHRDYVDYDKVGEEGEQPWSPDRRDKGERKGDRSPPGPYHSPSHDSSHGEEKGKNEKDGERHRRVSGDNRHHGSGKDRGRARDKDRNHDSRDRSRDRHEKDRKDKHDRSDKEKRDRHRSSKDYGQYQTSDDYESPPGIYDSPSDEEYGDARFGGKKPKTLMSLVEGEYLEPSMAAAENDGMEQPMRQKMNKKKMLKRKEYHERMRQKEREREFDEDQPVKKKPLLQTPMEERPVCKFFKEGKCQKGMNCLFKHDYSELPKRLELCRYYLKAYCRQEDECPFMHSEFPCKYFHTGAKCFQGDNCKFSHAPLTPETEEALNSALNEHDEEDHYEPYEGRKHKKKGLLGDQPPMSEEELQRKLEHMKKIPSIFDIETFAPGESPNKPKPPMGQSPSNIRPQGFYQDPNMSPQSGQNMRFNGPANQGTPPPRPFMQGPGMEGPVGMQGPPMGGPGLMGPGPPPMGPQGPGMQGPPLGPAINNPPMSQAAALVGAILRAAPMLQQYRGPSQGPPTSLANSDPRFMGPPPNMMAANMGQGPPPGIMSPGQDAGVNQGSMQGNQGPGQEGTSVQQNTSGGGMAPVSRDPRRNMGAQNDPRINRDAEGQKPQDVDMRGGVGRSESLGDVDLRQDVDMRQEDGAKKPNQGNTTPQQEWDDDSENRIDDSDIPSHLPPKQREMFLRIKQHTMKMNAQTGGAEKMEQQQQAVAVKDDDKWYSSDEDEESKPDISNILKSISQNEVKADPDSQLVAVSSSSFSVMQMINAIKSSTPSDATAATSASRATDPRLRSDTKPKMPIREPAVIMSHEGDCPWRLCKVVYTKQRIPTNLELLDSKYKNDPRVQKLLKLQELESGMFIDHTKTQMSLKGEGSEPGEQKPINLLDPRAIKPKEPQIPKVELAPFVDPRFPKGDNTDSQIKSEPGPVRPLDPRMKQGMDVKPSDPRMAKFGTHNLPVKPFDPRLARQDSNSNTSSAVGRVPDPRLARQNSKEPEQIIGSLPRSSTPPIDPRQFNRQSSGDPRLQRTETAPASVSASVNKPFDPRLGRVMEVEAGQPSVQRQLSQPGTGAEKDAASNSNKPKLDYRNDPRFKRKHISESNLPPETLGKRYTGQRKSSTEYSSPLGDESAQLEESGYNSCNRPRPPNKPQQGPSLQPTAFSDIDNSSNKDITTHDILDSIQIMPPPTLEPTQGPDKNLKDIFKTIDPTASPFC